jgi:Kef-type K+ transport system membrane component KefB
VFFFAFGLSINVGDVASVVGPIGGAVVLTALLNAAAGLVAARLYRFGAEPATNVGLTILARGEFSLVLAAVATGPGSTVDSVPSSPVTSSSSPLPGRCSRVERRGSRGASPPH